METKKCRARYVKFIGPYEVNPFGLRFSVMLPEKADVVAEISVRLLPTEVEDMAKAATPEGYTFVGVEEVTDF